MPVPFNHIPANLRLPLFWAEIDPSRAGSLVLDRRILIAGHGLTTAHANVPTICSTDDQAASLWSPGSQVHEQMIAARKANSFDQILVANVPEPSAGAKAAGTIVVDTAPSAIGTYVFYVNGRRQQVAAVSSDTTSSMATKIAAAINADTHLPVTASATSATVTCTCKWKGLSGNSITIVENYLGMNGGEEMPTGMGTTITAMSSGSGAPDLDTLIANMGDQPYETNILGWNDTASLDDFRDEFAFGDAGRWGWLRQQFGLCFTATDGTVSGLATVGNARNEATLGNWGLKGSPTPYYARAAAWGAVHHRALLNDPARPVSTLEIPGVLAPKAEDRFSAQERNALLYDGISVSTEDDAGVVRVGLSITSYQKNAFQSPSDALLKIQTLATNAYLLRSMRQRVETRFPRHKLANDGTRFGPGQPIATPAIIEAEVVAHYGEMEFIGLVENSRAFKKNLVVERDVTNPNRANVLYPPDLINQLDVFALINQFRLQYATATGAVAVPTV